MGILIGSPQHRRGDKPSCGFLAVLYPLRGCENGIKRRVLERAKRSSQRVPPCSDMCKLRTLLLLWGIVGCNRN